LIEILVTYLLSIECSIIISDFLDALGTIDYVDDNQDIILRTCNKEKERLVVQIGTCDPERALAAAKLIEQDVSGIDINMDPQAILTKSTLRSIEQI